MKALSIRQPWAWLVVNGLKDVENRSWVTSFRGRVYIHASAKCTRREYKEAVDFVSSIDKSIKIPPLGDLCRGGVIGEVEIVGCVNESDSPWFVGAYGFELRNARVLRFHPCKGRLGFFRIESMSPS